MVSPTSRVRPRATARAVALVVHRYVGLAMAVFLLVAGCTGTLIAFYEELDDSINSDLHAVQAPADLEGPLDALELRERLISQLPAGFDVGYAPLHVAPDRSLQFFVTPANDATDADDNYFVDPYSGQVLGSRRWGDIGQGARNLMPFLYKLHYSLALGDVGMLLFGIIALLWTLDCFVGAYLTLPQRRKGARNSERSWLSRWKPSWLIRANKLFALIFTWHRATGLWVWAMLFAFAWSAVGLNLNGVYTPVMKAIFGTEAPAYERLPQLEQPRPDPELSWLEARAVGRDAMAALGNDRGFQVLEERGLSYRAGTGLFRYRVLSTLDIADRFADTTLWLDGNSGQLVEFEQPVGENLGGTVSTWLYTLHFGDVASLGVAYRFFVSLMGAAVALLSITGVWIWWRKRKQRRSLRARRADREPDSNDRDRAPVVVSSGPS